MTSLNSDSCSVSLPLNPSISKHSNSTSLNSQTSPNISASLSYQKSQSQPSVPTLRFRQESRFSRKFDVPNPSSGDACDHGVGSPSTSLKSFPSSTICTITNTTALPTDYTESDISHHGNVPSLSLMTETTRTKVIQKSTPECTKMELNQHISPICHTSLEEGSGLIAACPGQEVPHPRLLNGNEWLGTHITMNALLGNKFPKTQSNLNSEKEAVLPADCHYDSTPLHDTDIAHIVRARILSGMVSKQFEADLAVRIFLSYVVEEPSREVTTFPQLMAPL